MVIKKRPEHVSRCSCCVVNEELRLWDVLVDPARKIRIGNKLYFGDDDSMVAEVIDNTTSRGRTLRFLYDGPHDEFKKALYALGEPPLPPFIHRPAEPEDEERFQTIFAKNEGAVTVPAAGLHFSRGDEAYGNKGYRFLFHYHALRTGWFP